MKNAAALALALLCLLANTCLAARRVNDLERLVAKEQLTELHWHYNGNMDAIAALRSIYPVTDARVLNRVALLRDIFCPDPIFKGWLATGGINGSVSMSTRYRDIPDPLAFPTPNQSVVSIYRDVLPGLFGNSSQHFVGMPIITVYYDENNQLRAEFNATLRQVVNIHLSPNPPMVTDILGHYNNKFVFLNPPGNGRSDSYWCMEQFNAFNAFSVTHFPGTYAISEQNALDAQLSVAEKPPVDG